MRKLIFIFTILTTSLMGQSAYYGLGYGDLFPSTDPLVSSIGQGVVALRDTSRVTLQNPAGLNNLKRVYFGVGLGSEYRTVSETMTNNTRMEQFYFAFPVGNNVGMSLSAQAVADFNNSYEVPFLSGTLSQNSDGGIWDYSVGLGYALNPSMSFGLKWHAYHGFIRRESVLESDELAEMYVLRGGLNGQSLELGLSTEIFEKVSLGLTIDLPYDRPTLDGRDSLAGTDTYVEFSEELAAWPSTVKFGVVYHHTDYTKFVAGIGQQIFPESGFDSARLFSLPDGWHTVPVASFQMSMLRAARDRMSRSWAKRTGWQVGLSAKNYYLVSGSDDLIHEYSIVSGMNLRLRNGRSLFDVSGEFGTRGGEVSLPEEQFIRVKFGIQVNDTWFRKVKRR